MTTPIAKMVREMIERGVDVDVIELAVSTAERMLVPENPQTSAESADERRRRKDREKKAEIRRNRQISADNPQTSENASISKEDKKESKRHNSGNRGTRIASDWAPSETDRTFAKQEGFSEFEVQREASKFRDYWTACAGSRGVKLDWPATWRQWIRSTADRAGKRPAASGPEAAVSGFYAAADTPQLDAWDRYNREQQGKGLPRDRNGGWRVKAEWPPGYVQPDTTHEAPIPLFRSMS